MMNPTAQAGNDKYSYVSRQVHGFVDCCVEKGSEARKKDVKVDE